MPEKPSATPSSQHTIRPLYSEDIAEIMNVWESSVLASHDFLSEADFLFFRDLVSDTLQKILLSRHHVLSLAMATSQAHKFPFHGLFDAQENLCGIMAVQQGSINALFIHGDKRRMGYGSILMRYALHELGAHKVSVNEQNPPAIRFYQKWGFEVYKRTELDQTGKPYPILYMHRPERA